MGGTVLSFLRCSSQVMILKSGSNKNVHFFLRLTDEFSVNTVFCFWCLTCRAFNIPSASCDCLTYISLCVRACVCVHKCTHECALEVGQSWGLSMKPSPHLFGQVLSHSVGDAEVCGLWCPSCVNSSSSMSETCPQESQVRTSRHTCAESEAWGKCVKTIATQIVPWEFGIRGLQGPKLA